MSLPAQIGRYKVTGLLGKGAMGIVYRGRDEKLDRDVALKLVSGQADEDSRARFKREALAAARLSHPNIVTVYELGEHEGQPFMALELLEGVDLQGAIEAGLRPDPKVTLPIVLQVLAGLGHAHDHGIVHRDVKPSNIFLPRGRPAKVMDFGVARLGTGMTTAGMVVGTPNYMSPEQVRASGVDGRSDLFSVGLILYELVTGEKAYQAKEIVALLYKIAHEPPDFSLIPKGPQWERLRAVLARAVEKDAERRFADAHAMSAELALALQDLGGSANWAAVSPSDQGLMVRTRRSEPSPLEEAQPPPPPPAPVPPAPAPAVPPPVWRQPLVVAGALGGVSAVILAAALSVLLRPAPSPPPPSTTLAAPSPGPTSAPGPAANPSVAPPPSPLATSTAAPPPTPKPGASTQAPPPPQPPEETVPAGPAPQDARIERADQLLQSGRYAQALAEARAVLRREPKNPEAKTIAEEAEAALVVENSIKKGREALSRGDKDEALQHIKTGLAVNSNDRRLLELFREATR